MNEKQYKNFMDKVQKDSGPSGCWVWTGGTNGNGYGQFGMNGKVVKAHKVSYEHFIGPIGDKLCLHKCNHRWCVNPEHLKLGTYSENSIDCSIAGKNRVLTNEQVVEIKKVLALGGRSMTYLARRFGVAVSSIQCIKEGRSYTRVTI